MNTVLVVDDEPAIRELLDIGLSLGGFRVQLASDGREALSLYKDNQKGFDLVLLDIRMPGLDGLETLAALRKLNPTARCCFLSGHIGDFGEAALRERGALQVFDKPIGSLIGFVKQVRQLLA